MLGCCLLLWGVCGVVAFWCGVWVVGEFHHGAGWHFISRSHPWRVVISWAAYVLYLHGEEKSLCPIHFWSCWIFRGLHSAGEWETLCVCLGLFVCEVQLQHLVRVWTCGVLSKLHMTISLRLAILSSIERVASSLLSSLLFDKVFFILSHSSCSFQSCVTTLCCCFPCLMLFLHSYVFYF